VPYVLFERFQIGKREAFAIILSPMFFRGPAITPRRHPVHPTIILVIQDATPIVFCAVRRAEIGIVHDVP